MKSPLLSTTMKIEVVFALPQQQRVVSLQVHEGTTARQAVLASGLDRYFTGIDLARVPLGIFAEVVADDHRLEPGDRIELYRPLTVDPMQARRRRAATAKTHRAEPKSDS